MSMIQMMKKEVCLMDLPESTLDHILERLSPLDLCSMSEVCTSLVHRCRSNGLWEKHIHLKWGTLIGYVAYREWEGHVKRIMNNESPLLPLNANGMLGTLRGVWPFLCLASYLQNPRDFTYLLMSNYSNLALYISLQSGRFWFPSQVYCMKPRRRLYDALLSYDSVSNTFRARYPTLGWRVIEENIKWDRVRLSLLDTTPHTIYVSNCLNDLKPGDHIEIQGKRGRDLPYDWYYGVIGHLESCEEDENHCRCVHNEMLVVMFKLYHRSESSKPVVLNRKVNGEQIIGFWKFGGIRKLDNQEDIQRWNIIPTVQL